MAVHFWLLWIRERVIRPRAPGEAGLDDTDRSLLTAYPPQIPESRLLLQAHFRETQGEISSFAGRRESCSSLREGLIPAP